MNTRLEPPIDQWPTPTADRPVWTGHQLSLFHPGIVAKYLAAEAKSKWACVGYHNVVVDQDVYNPLSLTLPHRDPRRPRGLFTKVFTLGPIAADVPIGMQPPVTPAVVETNLRNFPSDAGAAAQAVRQAFSGTEQAPSLAAQMDTVVRRLLPSFAAAEPATFASAMLTDESELIDQLLRDAPRCAKLYNAAVREFRGAGMKPMSVEPDRVEVPLWALRWMKPRQRVFVDLADSTPIFITEDGEPLPPEAPPPPEGDGVTLAPRALLMTALLRRPDRCGLFIHGTGGWSYDRITEQWWQQWRGGTLAPMALVTADVTLDFGDVPVNTPADVERAVWRAHHLPHNLDRELGLDHPSIREKRELLQHMHDDRDKRRRRAAFDRIHRINRELADEHGQALAEAQQAVETARLGVANARLARKRDWPFLLYPPSQLETLRQQIAYPLREASGEPASSA
ncbi:MAG: hypothetical protein AAGH99_10595 [Planctomycetota bacterium]